MALFFYPPNKTSSLNTCYSFDYELFIILINTSKIINIIACQSSRVATTTNATKMTNNNFTPPAGARRKKQHQDSSKTRSTMSTHKKLWSIFRVRMHSRRDALRYHRNRGRIIRVGSREVEKVTEMGYHVDWLAYRGPRPLQIERSAKNQSLSSYIRPG